MIQNPIDLRTIGTRLREQNRVENENRGYYRTREMLKADLLRMVRYESFHPSDMCHH